MHLLVTGASGRVGTCVVAGLRARGHRVRAFDRRPPADGAGGESLQGELGDFDQVRRAVDGVEAVIHLGGNAGERPWPEIANNNYIGCYHVFEAARELGVRRVVFASRAGLLWLYPDEVQRRVDMLPRPVGLYDNSKLFGEMLASMYASRHGMECVCVRIGNFSPDRDRPGHPHQLSHGDCVRLFEQAVTHPVAGFEIVFGVSASDWPLYDVDHGRRAIGYEPRDVSRVPAEKRTFRGDDGPAEPLSDEPPRRVLITGAAGQVGRVLARGLRGRCEVRGMDRAEMPELSDTVVAPLGDFEACLRATRDVDAVVHLGGTPSGGSPWEEVWSSNFVGTWHIMEAVRRNRVPRVAYASRAGILSPYPKGLRRTVDLFPRPESYYTISKIFGEGLGHTWAWRHGTRFVGVRIGNFSLERDQPAHPHQLGHEDAVRVFEAALTHTGSTYEIVFGVSDSDWPLYDVDHGRRAIGYEPAQRSEVPEAERN